jgi:hypothetical protein
MSDAYGGPLDAANTPDDWDRSPSGFKDMDAPHPFPDGNSASGFSPSNSSTFNANHFPAPGEAKEPGMSGFSGDAAFRFPEPPQ